MGLIYVGIRVTDLERSVKFYTGALGLKERKRGKMSHGGLWVGLIDPVTSVSLELNWYPPDSPFHSPYTPGEGLDHIGFEVPDAKATIRAVIAAGGELAVAPWLEDGRYWIGFVKDPDGNWLEIQGLATATPAAPKT
ncbi:MAG: VOC family protein [Thermoplasmata archaeon]|nr:VOC family protein [Thermoplasmata archaeon]